MALLAAWMAGSSGGGKMIPFWVYETAVATGLVVASFRAFCDQRRIVEKEIEKSASMERTFKDVHDRIEAAHAGIEAANKSHIELLEVQIQTLQARLEENGRRKKIKDALAGWRITIQNLTSQLHDIFYYSYRDETRQNFERDYLDMLNTAHSFLDKFVGRSEATTFVDAERVPKVELPPSNDMFRDRQIAKAFMLNRLKYNAELLEKIEEKLDSKDFFLPLDNSGDLL